MRIRRVEVSETTRALQEYTEARHAAEEADNRLKAAKQKVIDLLAAAGQKTAEFTDGDKVYRATYYRSDQVRINEAGLKKAVSTAVWNKITKTVVEKPKLEKAIQEGLISPEQAGLYLTTVPSAPALRFSEGIKKEEEDDDVD